MLIQEKIRKGKYKLVWSYILSYENDMNPFAEKKLQIKEWEKYAIMVINESDSLLSLAEDIYKTGLKAKDALHVASAIEGQCDYFITTDSRILGTAGKISGISIISPLGFIEKEDLL